MELRALGRLGGIALWFGALVVGCGPQPASDDGDGGSGTDPGCVGEAPLCDPIPGDCYGPAHATCNDGEWSCPSFVFRCSEAESGEPIPDEPMESTGSESTTGTSTDTGTTADSVESSGAWTEEGPTPACEGDAPDCWDQGPGECADSTFPADCIDGAWTCPPGWATGGFGPGCTWPDEGGVETGDPTATDTGG